MTRAGRVVAGAILALGTFAGIAPAHAASPAWTVYGAQSVGGQNLLLNAVAVPAANDVWAVGYRYGYVGGATEFRTLIEHSSDGGSFTLVASPDREGAPATNFLQDVAAVSSTDIWAVGWSRNPRENSRTLVEHWNGVSWSIYASPDPGPYGNILQGVAARATDDVWAVGARQDGFYQSPMAQHWNGSSWTAFPVPNPAYCTGHSYLTDITAIPGSAQLWAVGWCTASSRGGEQGYVVRWSGTRWTVLSVSDGIPQNTELYGVSATTGHGVWIVGSQGGGVGALALRWNGVAWVAPTGWTDQPKTSLAGVVAPYASTQAWAVGAGPSPQPPFAGPTAVRLYGRQPVPVPVPVSYGSLRGVGYDPATKRLWAVGTQLPGQYNTPLVVSRPA